MHEVADRRQHARDHVGVLGVDLGRHELSQQQARLFVDQQQLLDPVDDIPPATIITSVRREGSNVVVHGVSHDNGDIVSVSVNDNAALDSTSPGVTDESAEAS